MKKQDKVTSRERIFNRAMPIKGEFKAMKKIRFAVLLFLAVAFSAHAVEVSSFDYAGELLVKNESLTGNDDGTKVVSAKDAAEKARRATGRPTGKGSFSPKWIPRDLIYLDKGALEQESLNFFCDKKKGFRYQPGSFAYSGAASALRWQYPNGWGVENLNGDFFPLLIRTDYENRENVPYYEFYWQHQTDVPFAGDSLYLNYAIKIPKESRAQWADEFSRKSFTLADRIPHDAPAIVAGKLFRWQRGTLLTYGNYPSSPDILGGWNMPDGLEVNGFAIDSSRVFYALKGGTISVLGKDGKQIASFPGRDPVILYNGLLIYPDPYYRKMICADAFSYAVLAESPLPDYLPKDENCLAVSTAADGVVYCFLYISSSSKFVISRIVLKKS